MVNRYGISVFGGGSALAKRMAKFAHPWRNEHQPSERVKERNRAALAKGAVKPFAPVRYGTGWDPDSRMTRKEILAKRQARRIRSTKVRKNDLRRVVQG
jgi:hypothetical protein